MQRSIKREIENLRETERLLNLRLLYLYEKSDQLKKDALKNKADKKKAAQSIMRYKIIEKEIPILEKQWFYVFEYILALENAILWREFYQSLKASADIMKMLNQRIERLDPTTVMSNAQAVMDEYRVITESLSAWSECQEDLDEQELMLILNGGKKKKEQQTENDPTRQKLGDGDQEEEMFSELDTRRTRPVQSFPSVPTTPLPKVGQRRDLSVKQFA